MNNDRLLIVTKRTDDYHATLASNPAIWGCGRTPIEAIGDLLLAHQYVFNVTVDLSAITLA